MANTLAEKLRIKAGFVLLTLKAPDNFEKKLLPLPDGVTIQQKTKHFHQVHWFVSNKSQLEKELDKVLKLVSDNIVCWVYYPKGSSNIQTDLTRDKGWDALLKHKNLQWISLISFDQTWSTFGFRMKTPADLKREKLVKPREIFNYVNPETKEVILPTDFSAAIRKAKPEMTFFNSLSFSNKKEYIEWIVTAKKEETRKQRIDGTLERLAKGWKNPRNL